MVGSGVPFSRSRVAIVWRSEWRPCFCGLRKVIPASWRQYLIMRSEEHTSELQSRLHLVCRLLLEKKKKTHLPPAGSDFVQMLPDDHVLNDGDTEPLPLRLTHKSQPVDTCPVSDKLRLHIIPHST